MPLRITSYEITFTKYEQKLDNNKTKAKHRFFILSESVHLFGLKLNMNRLYTQHKLDFILSY